MERLSSLLIYNPDVNKVSSDDGSCTQIGSRGQRRMETQRNDVSHLFYSRRLLMMMIML